VRILSLDTTTRDGSAAIVEDDRIVDVRGGDGSRTHAERLPAELIAILDAHGLTFRDIDVFAVAAGPGSFTGIRIGIATIQGLSFTCGRRVVAVSALEALAHLASASLDEPEAGPRTPDAGPRIVVAWMDARRRDVFSAVYRVTAAAPFDPARMWAIDPARVGSPAAILDGLEELSGQRSASTVFTGDGAVLYADEIAGRCPSAQIVPPHPIAGAVGLLARARARRGETIDPAAIQPLYIRRPDAVIAREARE